MLLIPIVLFSNLAQNARDVVAVERTAARFVQAAGLPVEGKGGWSVSAGEGEGGDGYLEGGWEWTHLIYRRKDLRFARLDYTALRPYPGTRLDLSELDSRAGRLLSFLFPRERSWTTTHLSEYPESQWDPARQSRFVTAANSDPDGVRKVLIELELSTGRPLKIFVHYADDPPPRYKCRPSRPSSAESSEEIGMCLAVDR